MILNKKVNGNVAAKEKIDIKSKAELFGDIRAPKLVIEEGVTFVGKTEVNPNKATPAVPPPLRGAEPGRPPVEATRQMAEPAMAGRK